MLQHSIEVVKIARPGFWPTQLWFFVLPMAGEHVLGSLAFWVGATYVCFPLGLLLYGWNDLGDSETDRQNPRKDSWVFGARPDSTMRKRLPLIIAGVQLPFVGMMVWLVGPWILVWFVAVLATNWSYNNLQFKRLPVLDLVNQVGYLLIFLLAIWLCNLPNLGWPVLVFSALFAMQSHLFGQLMDIDEDTNAGRRGTAIQLGVRGSKIMLAVMMMVEGIIAAVYFRGGFVAVFMFSGAVFFAADAMVGPRRYPVSFTKLFFIAWNLIVIATMHLVWRYDWFMLAG